MLGYAQSSSSDIGKMCVFHILNKLSIEKETGGISGPVSL